LAASRAAYTPNIYIGILVEYKIVFLSTL